MEEPIEVSGRTLFLHALVAGELFQRALLKIWLELRDERPELADSVKGMWYAEKRSLSLLKMIYSTVWE